MNLIKPENLKMGDTIGIIAPSGVLDRERFLKGVENFQKLGFSVHFNERIFDKKRYLAGNDGDKIEEIESYFQNPEIDGIICARGGYGAIRLTEKINYEIIRKNPKYFGGYSDITALQLMFLKRAGLITYTSPMIQSDFGVDVISDFTIKNFLNPVSELIGQTIISGEANGILWGGNLSTIVSMCGLDFLPEEDFIFFVEDISEPVYKIDKMLHQLMNIKQFRKNIKGLVFGEFSSCGNEEFLKELEIETASELTIPAIECINITHSKDKLTLPVGLKAKICDGKLFL